MSGIYIPDIEMPKGANDCGFSECCLIFSTNSYEFFTCSLTKERCALERMGIGCPLVFVPDHGDLIDRDMVLEKAWDVETFVDAVKYAPIIIPADKGQTAKQVVCKVCGSARFIVNGDDVNCANCGTSMTNKEEE